MEKYFINQNIITSNGYFLSGKFLSKKPANCKYNTISGLKKNPSCKRINYFPVRNKVMELSLTNRLLSKDSTIFHSTINKPNTKSIIIKDKIYKYNDFKSYSLEVRKNNQKNIDYIMNNSIQKNIMNDEEKNENNKTMHENYMINYLLNKKMTIYPKLNQIKARKRNIIENIKHFYGEGIFLEKYEKQLLQKSKPVQYYFKNRVKNKNFQKMMKNMSDFLKHKTNYEIFEFNNKIEKFATRLSLDESDNKSNNNFNCHSLMKFPQSPRNNNLYNDIKNNGYIKTKFKLGKINDSNNNSNKQNNYSNLKLLDKKGYKSFEKYKYKGFNQKLRDTINDVKVNRQKYDSLAEMQLNSFLKNKDEIFSKDI